MVFAASCSVSYMAFIAHYMDYVRLCGAGEVGIYMILMCVQFVSSTPCIIFQP